MKVGTHLQRNFLLMLGLFFALAAPAASASAPLQITEVMYDAPGSDTGHEWVEISNTGSGSIDITGYKLFQSAVNHGITVVSGTTTLAVGESAIISNDTQKFSTDYPSYDGPLFKSSFSLTNVSGTASLKDNKLNLLDSVSYASSIGAAGDGNSLHYTNDAATAGVPNPGSTALTSPIVKQVSAPSSKTSATKSKTKSSIAPPAQLAATPDQALSGAPPLLPTLPQTNIILWSSLFGIAAFGLLGVAGLLYVRPPRRAETSPSADEFEIDEIE